MEVAGEEVHASLGIGWATILVKEVKDGVYMPFHLGAKVPRLAEVEHVKDL